MLLQAGLYTIGCSPDSHTSSGLCQVLKYITVHTTFYGELWSYAIAVNEATFYMVSKVLYILELPKFMAIF